MAGAEEPQAAPGSQLLSQCPSWGCWCTPVSPHDRVGFGPLKPPISRQHQESKGRSLGSHLASPLTSIHKTCESRELYVGRAPGTDLPERLRINKQAKQLLRKMVATSCLGWKELILARLFIGCKSGLQYFWVLSPPC